MAVPILLKGLFEVGNAVSEDDTCVPAAELHRDEGEEHVDGAHVVEGVLVAAPLGSI